MFIYLYRVSSPSLLNERQPLLHHRLLAMKLSWLWISLALKIGFQFFLSKRMSIYHSTFTFQCAVFAI